MHLGYTLKKIQQLQKMIEIPIEGISSFWPRPDTKHKKYSGVCSCLSTFLFLCYHHQSISSAQQPSTFLSMSFFYYHNQSISRSWLFPDTKHVAEYVLVLKKILNLSANMRAFLHTGFSRHKTYGQRSITTARVYQGQIQNTKMWRCTFLSVSFFITTTKVCIKVMALNRHKTQKYSGARFFLCICQ